MYLCVLAGILLATPCLADDDPLLEMSVPEPHTSPGHDDYLHAAFITDDIRLRMRKLSIKCVLKLSYIVKDYLKYRF